MEEYNRSLYFFHVDNSLPKFHRMYRIVYTKLSLVYTKLILVYCFNVVSLLDSIYCCLNVAQVKCTTYTQSIYYKYYLCKEHKLPMHRV